MDFKQYIVALYYDNKYPVCKCGCGRRVSFKPLSCGPWFRDYCQNHFPRKPHTQETKTRIRNTLKELYVGESPLKIKVREGVTKKLDQIHTKENTIKRIRASKNFWTTSDSDSERQNRSVRLKERWESGINLPNDPSKIVEKLKETNPEKYEKWRRKISIIASEQQSKNGTNLQYTFKCKIKNPFSNNWEYCDSSWEFLFMRWCYAMNIQYERSTISIGYVNENSNWALYNPDFILPLSREIIETKGYFDENTSLKREAAINWCNDNGYSYILADYSELTSIGLDLNKKTIKNRIKSILLANKDTMYPLNPKKYFGESCNDFD
jgi:hypothetical protein